MFKHKRLLAVDIGNSGLRLADLSLELDAVTPIKRIDWLHAPAVRSERSCYSPDDPSWRRELAGPLQAYNEQEVVWLISSVRRDASALLADFIDGRGEQHHFVGCQDIGLQLSVDQPELVGVDRLLAAAAAVEQFSDRPLIVLQAGSALTIDLVTGPNVFNGGAILPGVPMILRLLGHAADLLPQLEAEELIDLPQLPGRNTESAMKAGAASALVGGAIHAVTRYRTEYGSDCLAVLSGGDGFRLANHLPPPIQVVPQLVLRGLLQVAHKLPFNKSYYSA